MRVVGGFALRLAALYVLAYVLADWVSYVYPLAPFAITPWNPPPGLTLALLLVGGLRYAPAVLVAVLAAEFVVRGVPGSPWATLAASLVIAGGYSALGAVLLRAVRVDPKLGSLRDLSRLLATVAAGTAAIAVAYVGVFHLAGQVAWGGIWTHFLRFWIGDMIGVVVTTPLILVWVARRRTPQAVHGWEIAAQAGAIVLALGLAFHLGSPNAARLFYVLFLPLIWIAMRHGIRGAALGALGTQLGLIVAAKITAHSASSVLEMQFLMLALAATTLLLGMAVTERREVSEQLRERQDDLARTLRFVAAGEMASALAHELNQPLSAIGSYLRACQLMLQRPDPDRPRLAQTMDKVVAEAARAGDVVRRLREFFRTGTSRLEPVSISELLRTGIEPARKRAERHRVQLRVDVAAAAAAAAVLVDRLQLEIVIHNLVANAIDAIVAAQASRREVRVTARADARQMRVEVRDTGPGVAPELVTRLFEPFATSKAQGMGLGLALSRSIIEAHGGRLEAISGTTGGAFAFTLPLEPQEDRVNR